MNQYFDIGANLTHPNLISNIEKILKDSLNEGVNKISVTASNIEESIKAIDITKKNPEILICTCGIHPHEAKKYNSNSYSEIKDLCKEPEVFALGETGLDYHRNFSSKKEQIISFEKHVELSIELNKPLFLHVREAHSDFISILDTDLKNLPNVVVHCFTGTANELQDYIDREFFIGITGWICDERRGSHLKSLIKNIPLNKLMIETDAPYLLPRNSGMKNSTMNEPKYLSIIAKEVILNREEENRIIIEALYKNSQLFFGVI